MRAFIKSLDEKVWKSIMNRRKHPTTKDEIKTLILKPEDPWTTAEDQLANDNSKALNAIFSPVNINQFKLISVCESTKEEWDILQVAFEGTASIRMTKLQMLASRFEDLRMLESESTTNFNGKLCDIASEVYAFGEKDMDIKLIRETLRSLLERFAYKVIAIEESHDITKMRLDELIGSLQTFQMNLKQNKREKEVALQVDVQTSHLTEEIDDNDKAIALLTKNFGKFFKKISKKSKSSQPSKTSILPKSKNSTNSSTFSDDMNNRRIQCHECKVFEHIQSKCANTLKKIEKSLNTTWSDEDSYVNQEEKEEHISNYLCNVVGHVATSVILVNKTTTTIKGKEICSGDELNYTDLDCNSDEEEPNTNKITTMYNKMFHKWLEVCKTNKSSEAKVVELTFLVIEKDKVIHTSITELESACKSLTKINTGKVKLDEILSYGRVGRGHHGLRFVEGSCTPQPRPKRFIPICYFCNILGHICLKCFKYLKALKNRMHIQTSFSGLLQHGVKHRSRQTPNIKIDLKLRTSLKANTCESWYFDSSCSKHMTGNKENLENYKIMEQGHIIFGDGVGGIILGNGTLDVEGLPKLNNVLYVEGLKANLISISQLCDQNLFVKFTKDIYQVFDETNKCVLTGLRSFDNCYLLKHENPNLVDYCDADWAGDANDRKSTTRGCFFMGNNLVS
ncbi:hypothetical protein Pfo_021786 [Paulownia fortunei]|nr:hypothetical protein Pfo_021786 [Paulownia fortunei]